MKQTEFVARSILGETGAIREVQPSDAKVLARYALDLLAHLERTEVRAGV